MKKTIASAAVALLIGGGLAVASVLPASATEECTPSEAWTEVVVITPEIPAIPGVPEIPAVPDSYQRYSWVGGPTETAPTDVPPSDNWQANTTNYEGAGHGSDPIGEPFAKNDNGKGDWFYWTFTPGTPAVPAVPEVPAVPAVTQTIEHPAVTCEQEPEEPTTYQPTCTTVVDEAVIYDDGVLSVEGGWATDSISVPFSGTLADIGTVLDIEADPIQYVGLHIRTAQGSITFEEEPSYGGNLWSDAAWDGVDAGMGYPAFGSISQYIELNGDVPVTGIDLLYTHPEASSTTVTSFTIGCTLFTFGEEPVVEEPEPEEPVTPVTPEEPAVVTPVPTATETPAPVATTTAATLAATGGPNALPWAIGGLAAMLAGLSVWAFARARAARQ